jgi:hypothetical protein
MCLRRHEYCGILQWRQELLVRAGYEACFTGCGAFFGLGDEEYGGLSTTAI